MYYVHVKAGLYSCNARTTVYLGQLPATCHLAQVRCCMWRTPEHAPVLSTERPEELNILAGLARNSALNVPYLRRSAHLSDNGELTGACIACKPLRPQASDHARCRT